MAKVLRWDDFLSFFNTNKQKLAAKMGATENITYSALLATVNNGTLTAGQQYRITDYVTTTAQTDTQSAGHQFDIIVTADSTNTLNHSARAVLHKGDTYFANSNLAAWRLKYDIKNDTTKYAWASSSGKGVIYEMVDEFNNRCGYDFKNIRYRLEKYKYINYGRELYDDIQTLVEYELPPYFGTSASTKRTFRYTFDIDGSDYSLQGRYCHDNLIGTRHNQKNRMELNYINFQSDSQGSNCCNNVIGENCCRIIIPDGSYNNTFAPGIKDCYILHKTPLIGKHIGVVVNFNIHQRDDNKADIIVWGSNMAETDVVIEFDVSYQDRTANDDGDWEQDNYFTGAQKIFSSTTNLFYTKTFPFYDDESGYATLSYDTSLFKYSLGDVIILGFVEDDVYNEYNDVVLGNAGAYVGAIYTKQPTRIGTWVDGTPVYRVALPYIQMQNGVRGVRADSATNSVYLDFQDLFTKYVIEYDEIVAFLGGWINWYSENPNIFKGGVVPNGDITFCENNVGDYEDYIEFGNGYWGGYVDFVSKASNIR